MYAYNIIVLEMAWACKCQCQNCKLILLLGSLSCCLLASNFCNKLVEEALQGNRVLDERQFFVNFFINGIPKLKESKTLSKQLHDKATFTNTTSGQAT